MTNWEAFAFFLGGLVVGLCGRPIVAWCAEFFEPPFSQGRQPKGRLPHVRR